MWMSRLLTTTPWECSALDLQRGGQTRSSGPVMPSPVRFVRFVFQVLFPPLIWFGVDLDKIMFKFLFWLSLLSDSQKDEGNYDIPGFFMRSERVGFEVHSWGDWQGYWKSNCWYLPLAECFHPKSQNPEGSKIWPWQVDGGMYIIHTLLSPPFWSWCFNVCLLLLILWILYWHFWLFCLGSWWLPWRYRCEGRQASWWNNGWGGDWTTCGGSIKRKFISLLSSDKVLLIWTMRGQSSA